MKKLFSLFVPSDEKIELEAIETWIVKWRAYRPWRNDKHSDLSEFNIKHQAFSSKEDAEMFESALRESEKLLKSNCVIEIYKE